MPYWPPIWELHTLMWYTLGFVMSVCACTGHDKVIPLLTRLGQECMSANCLIPRQLNKVRDACLYMQCSYAMLMNAERKFNMQLWSRPIYNIATAVTVCIIIYWQRYLAHTGYVFYIWNSSYETFCCSAIKRLKMISLGYTVKVFVYCCWFFINTIQEPLHSIILELFTLQKRQ